MKTSLLSSDNTLQAYIGRNREHVTLRLLSVDDALRASHAGRALFFSDGHAELPACYYPGQLLSVDRGDSIPFAADCPDTDERWFCNAWEVVL